jgi:hypothetical protein
VPADGVDETGRPAPTARVAIVHRQARRTMALAAAFAAAAPVSALVPHDTGAWLPLHLALVGALLLAISGATRLFVVTWSAAEPVGDGVAAVQRWLLALGAAGLAAARELDAPTGLTVTAGIAVTAGIVLLGVLLAVEGRRSRLARYDAPRHFYLAAVAAGIAGTIIGSAMVGGAADARDAHVLLNLFGLVGLVIAGTLPTFVATQARTRMSPRATTGRLHRTLAILVAGIATAALGAGLDGDPLVRAGALAYGVGIAHLLTLLPALGRKQLAWAGPRLVQLGAGVAWWLGGVVAVVVTAGVSEDIVVAVVVGGYVQILAASLAYLVPVLRGGGHERLAAGFAITRSWLGLVSLNAGAALLLADAPTLAIACLAVTAADAARQAVRLRR